MHEKKATDDRGLEHHGDGGEYPRPSLSSSDSSHHYNRDSIHTSKKPFLKLDVNFDPSMYAGECNAKKLNNSVRQIEVYCRIQQIEDDEAKIQLASLRLSGIALVWWESRMQGSKNPGNLLFSWSNFVFAMKNRFFPLGNKQKTLME